MNNQNRFVIYENDDQFDFDQNDKKINIIAKCQIIFSKS